FTYRGQQKSIITQKEINDFYLKFDKIFLTNNALNLLKAFNKDINLPFWEKGCSNYNSKTHMFECFATNIFEHYMQVIHFDVNNTTNHKGSTRRLPLYKNIDNLSYEKYKGDVISLNINKFKTYVADGILTHN